MRTGGGADHVESVADVGDPIAHRFVHGVFQGTRAGFHGAYLGAEQAHAEDVRLLPLDVDLAHIDDAGKSEARRHGGGRHAVHARPGLGDDAPLAHAAGEQNLPQAIVDLVGAGVIEIFALEIDFGATGALGKAFGEIERAGAADVMGEQAVQLFMKSGVNLGRLVSALEIEDQRHQGFGDEATAISAEMAAHVGTGAIGIGRIHEGAPP